MREGRVRLLPAVVAQTEAVSRRRTPASAERANSELKDWKVLRKIRSSLNCGLHGARWCRAEGTPPSSGKRGPGWALSDLLGAIVGVIFRCIASMLALVP